MYSVTGTAGQKRNNHTAHGRTQFGGGRITLETTPFSFDCGTQSHLEPVFLCVASRCTTGSCRTLFSPFAVPLAQLFCAIQANPSSHCCVMHLCTTDKHKTPSQIVWASFNQAFGDGRVRPVYLSASPRGRPEVDQSPVAVCEPETRISVSTLTGTLLSPILQYACHRRGASTQLRHAASFPSAVDSQPIAASPPAVGL